MSAVLGKKVACMDAVILTVVLVHVRIKELLKVTGCH